MIEPKSIYMLYLIWLSVKTFPYKPIGGVLKNKEDGKMKVETKRILLAVLVITLVLISGFSVMTGNARAQVFTPSHEMKLITQPGNNVTFPLGSVGVSLPNAINPLYTETPSPQGYIYYTRVTPGDYVPATYILHAAFDGGLKPYTYQWYLNESGNWMFVGTGEYLIYTLNNYGWYNFKVEVTDQAFNTGIAYKWVPVYAPLESSGTASNGTTTVNSVLDTEIPSTPQLTTVVNGEIAFNVSVQGGYPFHQYPSYPRYYYKLHVDFGDGNSVIYTVNATMGYKAFSHTYDTLGTYTVSYYIEDQQRTTPTYYFTVGVTTGPLQTSLSIITPDSGTYNGLPIYILGENVTFKGLVSGGLQPYQIVWNFGDGTPGFNSTSPAIQNHAYFKQGLYRVWMNVTDCMGVTVPNSVQFYILYKAPTNAALSIAPVSVDPNNSTQIKNANFGNEVTEELQGGSVYYTLNLTWLYGNKPYNITIQMENLTTHETFNYTFTWDHSWSELPLYLNQSALPFVIDHTGDYRFIFNLTDSEGYHQYSNFVILHVVAPQFSASLSVDSTSTCVPGQVDVTITAHNLLANDTNGEANVTIVLYQNGVEIVNVTQNVSGSTQYFDHSWSYMVSINSAGSYNFQAVVTENSPTAESSNTNVVTVTAYSEHGLEVVNFGASPQILIGTAPYQVTFYINLSGGNGTLLAQFLSNHPNTEYYNVSVISATGGAACNPWYNFTFTYTYSHEAVYNTEFIFYSNNTAYTGPVYVNYTVTVYPPPPMQASFSMSPTLIYLEPGPNASIYNDYGYYNYTTISIDVQGGTTPYNVYVYLGDGFIDNSTLVDMTPDISYNMGANYIQFYLDHPMHIQFNAYYNEAGNYDVTVNIHDNSAGCTFVQTHTLTVVDIPSLDIATDAGSAAPTDVVAYGYAIGGAMPYQSIVLSINGQNFSGTVNDHEMGFATGSVSSDNGGVYLISLTVKDRNGYTFGTFHVISVSEPNITYPVIVSARMQVYFDETLVYAGPAIWNSQGDLNATFLMPNQEYGYSKTFAVNVRFSYSLWLPDEKTFYNVYSTYPYNNVPGELTVINHGMLMSVNATSDIATLRTLIEGTWQSVNVSYDYLVNTINPNLVTIQNGVAQLQVQGATIEAKLNDLNATIADIQNGIVTIKTDIGNIQTSLSNLDAKITDIQNGIATIQTDVGNIQTSVNALDAKITDVQNGIATVQTSLGNISADLTALDAKITDIQNGIATIQTDIGNIQTSLSNLDAKITDIQNGIATIQTDIGNIQTSLSNLDAKITKLQGDVATIQTDLGTINVKLDAINATVVSNANGINDLKGSGVEIQTTLGDIKGTVTDIKDGVATIQTDLGTMQTDVSDIKTTTSDTASGINTAIYWNIGVLILVIITLILVAYVLAKVNKISQGSKEETVEEETEETKEE